MTQHTTFKLNPDKKFEDQNISDSLDSLKSVKISNINVKMISQCVFGVGIR